MPDDSTRTVLVALGAGIGVTLAKVGAAVFTVRPAWPLKEPTASSTSCARCWPKLT